MALPQGFPSVWSDLTGRPNGPDNEPKPISWLRENSNYLTPKIGLTSADTWAALTIVVRNLILNWLVILPVFVLLVLGLKAVLAWAGYMAAFSRHLCWPSMVLAALSGLLLMIALRFATRNRPTRRTQASPQRALFFAYVLPAVLSAFVISLAAVTPCAYAFLDQTATDRLIGIGAIAGFLIYALSWLSAWPKARSFLDLICWAVSGTVYGVLVSVGAALYFKLMGMPQPDLADQASSIVWPFRLPVVLLLVLGTPWVMFSQLLAEMLFIGATSLESESDGDREWFGRAGGFLLSLSLAWFVLMFLVLVGSDLASAVAPKVKSAIIAAGGVSGFLTALLGKSQLTPAKDAARGPRQVSANLVLAIAACVFTVTLLIGISWLLDLILFGNALADVEFMHPHVVVQGWPPVPYEMRWIGIAVCTVGLVGVAAWLTVNVNRFSLHALYRNRLIRAYLGASNRTEKDDFPPDLNPFTKFAQSDNLRMYQLWPEPGTGHRPTVGTDSWRPFHVINMTLNIASTKRLAWQQRKAETFTVTPLYSGSSCKAFRSSKTYGDRKGISVGTAVAVSGAAASPNMGYHSSAPLSLLLAFFNVRLGWWLGNPGKEGNGTYKKEGPQVAIIPFLNEVFGRTTDASSYVYLSDGGHFENLGLYEMVRRRCRVIVVSDAGADPQYAFDDLGNAVRKIAIDLGVSITFDDGLQKLRRRPADGSDLANLGKDRPPRYAVGKIHYSNADRSSSHRGAEASEDGILLYIKPSYFGDESAGVRNYATAHPEFPHEGTLNQWFSESQVESYRALGFEIMDEVLKIVRDSPTEDLGEWLRVLPIKGQEIGTGSSTRALTPTSASGSA